MLKIRKLGFTLIEVVTVIIIIGVLATLAIPSFQTMRERSIDQEAVANLRLIAAGERIFRMEVGNYYVSTAPHITNINTNVSLFLPFGATRNWDYTTVADNAAHPQTCCALATRRNAGARTWRIRNTEEDPVQGGTCP